MAKAFECDRCKAFFKDDSREHSEYPDLCPSCMKLFNYWVRKDDPNLSEEVIPVITSKVSSRWTKEQDDFMIKHYNKIPISDIIVGVNKLGAARAKQSVRLRAYKLFLTNSRTKNNLLLKSLPDTGEIIKRNTNVKRVTKIKPDWDLENIEPHPFDQVKHIRTIEYRRLTALIMEKNPTRGYNSCNAQAIKIFNDKYSEEWYDYKHKKKKKFPGRPKKEETTQETAPVPVKITKTEYNIPKDMETHPDSIYLKEKTEEKKVCVMCNSNPAMENRDYCSDCNDGMEQFAFDAGEKQ